jgi:copper(I)-binding protein
MTRRWLLALLLPALSAAAGEDEDDHVARKGDIRVVHAWSRATAAEDGELTSRSLEVLEIPAGGEFALEPGAVFLKLSGLRRPLVQGQEFEVELTFAEAGALDVHVEVEAADATRHSHAGHQH